MSEQYSASSHKIKAPTSNDRNSVKAIIIDWARSIVPSLSQSMQIEDFGTGNAYCHILNFYSPGTVNLNKIIEKPKNQYEYMLNLKLFQAGLSKLKINIPFDMNQIAKLKFTKNWELVRLVHQYFAKESKEDDHQTQKQNLKIKGKRLPQISLRNEEIAHNFESLRIHPAPLSKIEPKLLKSCLFQKDSSALIDRIKEILLKECHNTEKINQLKTILGIDENYIKIEEQEKHPSIVHITSTNLQK